MIGVCGARSTTATFKPQKCVCHFHSENTIDEVTMPNGFPARHSFFRLRLRNSANCQVGFDVEKRYGSARAFVELKSKVYQEPEFINDFFLQEL